MNFKSIVAPILVFLGSSSFAQWSANPFPFFNQSYSVQATENSVIVSAYNEIHKTSDGGQTWTVIPVQFTNYNSTIPWLFYITRVVYVSETVAYSYNNGAGVVTIFKSVDGGTNWTLTHTSNGSIQNMQWVSPDIGYAVGSAGKVLKTTDAGESWVEIASPTQNDLTSLHFLDANHGVIVGNQIILRTTDGGRTWASDAVNGKNFTAVFLLSSKKGFTNGTDGIKPFVFDGSGNLDFNFNHNCIASSNLYFTDPLTGYYLSFDGIYKTVDGGNFWSLQKNTTGYRGGSFDFYGKDKAAFIGHLNTTPYTKKIFITETGGDPMPQNDARMLDIIPYQANLCRGEYPVKARIINEGINNLTNAVVKWSVNSEEQTPFVWTGNLNPGDTSDYFTVGVYNFNRTGRDFSVEVWPGLVNNQSDDNSTNDLISSVFRFNRFIGEYTIGGIDPDFNTITEALELFRSNGLCDHITFSFRNGVYSQPIIIHDTWNASSDFTITFQSESGNASDVSFINSISITSKYNITIRGLNLQPTSLIPISVTASNTIIEDNIITSTVSEGLIVSYYSNTGQIIIRNNKIIGGKTGLSHIYFNEDVIRSSKILVEGNLFKDQKDSAIKIKGSNASIQIRDNKIFSNQTDTHYYGINIEDSKESIISNNYIQCIGNSTYATGVRAFIGLFEIYYNTVHINTTIENGTAISITAANNSIVLNNNLANYSKSGSAISLSRNKIINIDYNNLYSRSEFIGFLVRMGETNAVSAGNLGAWQSITGLDRHSIAVDPQLLQGNTNIELATSNYSLNGAGIPIEELTNDLEGELRDIVHPDIGADEFDVPLMDLGIQNVTTNNVTCEGEANVIIRVSNFGKTAVSNFDVVLTIDEVNQSIISVNEAPGIGTSRDINLGAYTFLSGNHSISAALIVNGDLISRNDSSSTSFKVGGMSGTFTIGGSNPDYETISSAIDALVSTGVCGNVTFNIRSGVYNEHVMLPQIAGVSELNQIIFQSESLDSTSVKIEYPSTAVIFNGADWVTIQYLQLKSTDYGATILELKNGSNHNTLRSIKFSGYMNRYAIYSPGYYLEGNKYVIKRNEFNAIVNNRFDLDEDGYFMDIAIEWSGPAYVYDVGTLHARNNSFIGNLFLSNPIYATVKVSFQDGFLFDNNYLRSNSEEGGGIHLKECINHNSISGNHIYVRNIGIDINNFNDYGNAAASILANNVIISENEAIGIINSNKLNIHNNTIIGNNELMSMVIGFPSDFATTNIEDKIELKNNIIINKGMGVCLALDTRIKIQSDYNVFFASHDMPFAINKGNYWQPGSEVTQLYDGLNHWQQKTGLDQHSRFFMPRFVAEDDYHINSDPRLKGWGASVGLSTDIEGDPRNATTPDIGADEFELIRRPNDAGVTKFFRPEDCGSDQTVRVQIQNFGSNTLINATINWQVNNIIMPSFQWTGSLTPGEYSPEIALGQYNFNPSDTFDIVAWTTLPNRLVDAESFNDSTKYENRLQQLSGYYSLGGSESDFPTFQSALNYLNRVGVCGPVTFSINAGYYNEEVKWSKIIGSSEQNRITFEANVADDSVVISNDGWPYNNFDIKDLSFLTFRNLKFNKITFKFSGVCNGIEFISNSFSDADYYGIQIHFTEGSFSDIVIEDNSFNDTWFGAIWGNSIEDLLIKNNTFRGTARSIQLAGSDGQTQILSNKIESGDQAIQLTYTFGSINIVNNTITHFIKGIEIRGGDWETPNSLVANNMIQAASQGFYSFMTKNFKYLHNSVNIVSDDIVYKSPYAAFYSEHDSAMMVMNNSFVNSTVTNSSYSGFSVIFNQPHSSCSIDYNNLWSVNNKFNFNSQPTFSLAEYQNLSGLDEHSISVNPLYVSTSDLHALNPSLNGRAIPLAEVTTDIDGETRDSLTPDIGADEFITYPANASIISVDTVRYCLGQNDIYATLQNKGSSLLGNVTLEWTVNGIQQPSFLWSGELTTQMSESIKIGSYDFQTLGNYVIEVWSKMPNGMSDPLPGDDKINVTGVYPAASGIYTIGGANPDFATINDAVSMLKLHGICGDVTFNIRPGTYNEQMHITGIPGSENGHRIIFQSENRDRTSVVTQFAANDYLSNYVWRLQDTGFVTIRDITVNGLDDNYSTCFYIDGECHSLQLFNNTIIAPLCIDYNNAGNKTVIAGSGTYGSSIKNNEIIGGYSGIGFGNNYKNTDENTLPVDSIINNTLIDQFHTGISGYGNKYLIQGNTITNNSPKSATYSAIRLSYDFRNSSVLNNNIYVYGSGIHAENTYKTTIANNFISIRDGLDYRSHGISLIQCSQIELYYNSVLINDVSPLSAGLYIEQVNLWNGSKTFIRNNIFANMGGGLCFDVYYQVINTDYFISENNNLYKTGQYYGRRDKTVFYSDLNSWIEYSGQEKNDVTTNPLFVSSTDLHGTSEDLIGMGKPVSVTTDYDGQTRHETRPTIGADEFGSVRTVNIGIANLNNAFICDMASPISFSLKNLGLETLINCKVSWQLNGQTQPQEAWSGTIQFGKSTLYSIPRPALTPGTYAITITVTEPNGKTDEVPENNIIEYTFTVYPSVHIELDRAPCTETITSTVLDAGNFETYEWSTGELTQTITTTTEGTYSVLVQDLNGCISTDQINLRPEYVTAGINFPDGDSFCAGSKIIVYADSGGTSYQWYRNNAPLQNQTFREMEIDIAGEYHAVISTPHCTFITPTVYIPELPLPAKPTIIPTGPTAFCEGSSVTLSSNQQYFNYKWSDTQTSATVVVSTSGNYSLQGVDSNGCLSLPSDEVTIVVNDLPEASITSEGNLLKASAGDQFSWYFSGNIIPNATSQTLIAQESGTYKVEVTKNGCTSISNEFDFLFTNAEAPFVFPNPADASLNINIQLEGELVSLLDNLGHKIKPVYIEIGLEYVIIDTSGLKSGQYLLEVKKVNEVRYIRVNIIH